MTAYHGINQDNITYNEYFPLSPECRAPQTPVLQWIQDNVPEYWKAIYQFGAEHMFTAMLRTSVFIPAYPTQLRCQGMVMDTLVLRHFSRPDIYKCRTKGGRQVFLDLVGMKRVDEDSARAFPIRLVYSDTLFHVYQEESAPVSRGLQEDFRGGGAVVNTAPYQYDTRIEESKEHPNYLSASASSAQALKENYCPCSAGGAPAKLGRKIL